MRNRPALLLAGLRNCFFAIWPAYLVASSLILWGFAWSLPDRVHIDKSFHADENAAVWGVNQIHFPGFNPHLFNWGTAMLYQAYVLKRLVSLGGLVYVGDARMILIGRTVVFLAALGTLTFLYLLAREILDEWSARVAALVLAVLPGFIINSHYFKTDVPMTCWLVASMWAGYRLMAAGKTAYVYALGLLTGYSISNKYNAAVVIPSVLVCLAFSSLEIRKIRAVVILGVCLTAGFLFGTPRVLPDPHEFVHTLKWVAQVGRQSTPWLYARGPGWRDYLTRISQLAMTLPVWLGAIFGIVWLTMGKGRVMLPILLFLIVYAFLLNADNVRVVRYTVPLLPFAALGVAGLLGELRRFGSAGRLAALAGAVVLVGYPALVTASYVRVMAEVDPRVQASEWIAAHASREVPFPVSTSFYMGAPQVQLWGFRKLDVQSDLAGLRAAASPYVAVSEYLTQKYDGALGHYPEVGEFFEYIDANYTEVARFENSQRLLWIDSKNRSTATHDWLYPNPRITIYRRNSDAPARPDFRGQGSPAPAPRADSGRTPSPP